MSKKWKVAIIGGGPAGSMTALSICRERPELAGDILIIEGRDFPREKVCGGGVSGKVVAYLRSMGISIEDAPYVKTKGMYVRFGDKESYVSFAGRDTHVIRRSVFDSRLLEAAMERGVTVRKGSPVSGAYRERNGVVLVGGNGEKYDTQVMVGADGVNGESRTWLGIAARKRPSLLLQADFDRDESDHRFDFNLLLDFSALKYGVPGYAWFFPSVDDEGNPVFNTGITGGSFGDAGSGSLLRGAHTAVAGLHPRFKGLVPRKFRYRPYPERDFSPFQANSGQRVLFVGEQIGVNPADGEGLGICADSAAIAAVSIIKALDRGDYSFRDYGLGLLKSDSLALWIASRIITACLTDRRFDVLFPLILNMNGDGREFIMDHYAKIFAGAVKGWTLYSPSLLKELAFGIGQLVSSSTRLL